MLLFISLFLLFVIFACALWFHVVWFSTRGASMLIEQERAHNAPGLSFTRTYP